MLKSIIILFLLIIITKYEIVSSEEICDFRLSSCPENYNGQNIYVPKKVVRFSPNFFVCEPVNVVEGISGKTPSIIFIIDNSRSMINATANDPTGARFKVTNALIDTIYKKNPDTEIGIIVFSELLYFDSRNDSNFATLPDGYNYPYGIETQAYFPLTKINTKVKSGQKSIDYIKNLLATEKNDKGIDLVYKPIFKLKSGTNINVAFNAAKFAFQKSQTAKENQYIIFLSDGASTECDGSEPHENFQKGIDVPATFTVFFVKSGKVVPKSIVNMTENIKNNNYSNSNKLSNLWSLESSYDTLLNLLMTNVIKPIIISNKSVPNELKVNNSTYNQYHPQDSSFYIPGGIQLRDSITDLNIEIKYRVRQSTSVDTIDSIIKLDFRVVRTDDVNQTENISIYCKDSIVCNVSVTAYDGDASEVNNRGSFEFIRSNSDGSLTVYFEIGGSAENGEDYSQIADSVVFYDGEFKKTVNVMPLVDNKEEGRETVWVKLLSSANYKPIKYNIKKPDSASIIIDDNYISMIVSVFAADNGSEVNNDKATFDFVRNKSEVNLTVYFEISGSAENGIDYKLINDSIVFKAGESSKALHIDPVPDNTIEGNEEVIIKLLNSKNGLAVNYGLSLSNSAIVIIADSLVKDTLIISIAPNPFSHNNFKSDGYIKISNTFKKVFKNDNDGIVISIYSPQPLKPSDSDMNVFGKAHFYDAVGNMVNKLEIRGIDKENGIYGSYWDGKNFNKRNCGSGIYLARLIIKDRYGNVCRYNEKIGIKK